MPKRRHESGRLEVGFAGLRWRTGWHGPSRPRAFGSLPVSAGVRRSGRQGDREGAGRLSAAMSGRRRSISASSRRFASTTSDDVPVGRNVSIRWLSRHHSHRLYLDLPDGRRPHGRPQQSQPDRRATRLAPERRRRSGSPASRSAARATACARPRRRWRAGRSCRSRPSPSRASATSSSSGPSPRSWRRSSAPTADLADQIPPYDAIRIFADNSAPEPPADGSGGDAPADDQIYGAEVDGEVSVKVSDFPLGYAEDDPRLAMATDDVEAIVRASANFGGESRAIWRPCLWSIRAVAAATT